jgi:ParB family transcriptional regulator, chromosome partitioning protein
MVLTGYTIMIATATKLSGIVEDIDINKIDVSKFLLRTARRDDVAELSQSIIEHGLFNPIIVRAREEFNYEIVAGNRRYIACKNLGYRKIACHVIELDDKGSFEISLIENIQRKTLHQVEEAQAFYKYIAEFGWGGASDLSRKIGKSISYVTRRMRLLELPEDVIESIISAEISTSAAEEVLTIKDKIKQSEFTKLITGRNLSIKQIRSMLDKKELNVGYSYVGIDSVFNDMNVRNNYKNDKMIDKSISILRIAMTRLSDLILDMKEEEEDDSNWIFYEMLMRHRIMLHQQIDQLIKQKYKKLKVYR